MELIRISEGFNTLTPDLVIQLVEQEIERPLTGLCRPMSSYINRVFELQTQNGDGLIAKFYRPGRWSHMALQDEHDFLFELDELEIPVISPLEFPRGGSLAEHLGMSFAIFPKKMGRALDEPDDEQWEMLGRLLARVHNVGAKHPPRDRIILTPEHATRGHVDYLFRHDIIPHEYRRGYESVTSELIRLISPMFKGIELIRIHGDCHSGNIVNRPGESLFLIDFDDMAVGPAVQDFWMLLPDAPANCHREIEFFLDGYNTFRNFDRRLLRLIEPLRAMRYIHFTAWCAVQSRDNAGAGRLVPGWGTPSYWREAIGDLRQQIIEIRNGEDGIITYGNDDIS